jgi:hypothetical protein
VPEKNVRWSGRKLFVSVKKIERIVVVLLSRLGLTVTVRLFFPFFYKDGQKMKLYNRASTLVLPSVSIDLSQKPCIDLDNLI